MPRCRRCPRWSRDHREYVEAAAVDEAMLMAGAVRIKPDDLTCVVDAGCTGIGARGIVEGSPGAAVSRAVEKAVALVARVFILPDNLTCVIDAVGKGLDGWVKVAGEVGR